MNHPKETQAVVLTYGGTSKGDFEEPVESFEVLARRLDEIALEYRSLLGIPFSVDLIRDNGMLRKDPSQCERLSVGLGNGLWVLFYLPVDEEKGSAKNSLGDPNAKGSVTFFFGDHTLISRKHLVPKQQAVEAIRQWLETGRIDGGMRWTSETFPPEST